VLNASRANAGRARARTARQWLRECLVPVRRSRRAEAAVATAQAAVRRCATSRARAPLARRARAAAAAALALAGTWQLGAAGWIHAKAFAAQVLLRTAWSQAAAHGAPRRPWSWADTTVVARLTTPGHGVDLVVLAGASGEALAFGPGLLRLPAGGMLIAGHRDTHFRFLGAAAAGDRLRLERPGAAPVEYRIRELRIVDHRHTSPLLDAGPGDLLLVTCWPLDALAPGGPLRLLAIARRT